LDKQLLIFSSKDSRELAHQVNLISAQLNLH